MKIALTGGSGFLGRYLIQRLATMDGHEVVGLTRQSRPPHRQSAVGPSPVQWVQGDLVDQDSLASFVQGADAIVHAALDRGGDRFMDHPDDAVAYFDTNVLGSLRLLEVAQHAGVSQVVFVSSGAVHEKVLEDRPLDETHPLWPRSLYGSAKASVETLMHAYGLSGRLIASTVRPTSIYGVAEPVTESKWYDLVCDVAAGRNVQPGGGAKSVHAADVAAAVSLILGQPADAVTGRTFNCCDRFISHHEVAEVAKQLSSSQAKILGEPKRSASAISTEAIGDLGMKFGGTELLRQTVSQMLELLPAAACQS